jgi:hypothetical protein
MAYWNRDPYSGGAFATSDEETSYSGKHPGEGGANRDPDHSGDGSMDGDGPNAEGDGQHASVGLPLPGVLGSLLSPGTSIGVVTDGAVAEAKAQHGAVGLGLHDILGSLFNPTTSIGVATSGGGADGDGQDTTVGLQLPGIYASSLGPSASIGLAAEGSDGSYAAHTSQVLSAAGLAISASAEHHPQIDQSPLDLMVDVNAESPSDLDHIIHL